jgi:hypothetical protein
VERFFLTIIETVRQRLSRIVLLRPHEKCHHLLL